MRKLDFRNAHERWLVPPDGIARFLCWQLMFASAIANLAGGLASGSSGAIAAATSSPAAIAHHGRTHVTSFVVNDQLLGAAVAQVRHPEHAATLRRVGRLHLTSSIRSPTPSAAGFDRRPAARDRLYEARLRQQDGAPGRLA